MKIKDIFFNQNILRTNVLCNSILIKMTDGNAKILKQIEFYFSDSNLPRDKYLKGLVDSNPQGYILIIHLILIIFNLFTCFIRHNYVISKNEEINNRQKRSY